jgi:nicotinate phosphoribosyltransferase
LVDTYDTLESGVPNAITVARELREQGYELQGIRLDSGDLAYFAKESRKMLDEAGFENVKIAASNQLDERVISSLRTQKAPIDIFGVGTKLVTGGKSPALDGVYKLSSIANKPTLKISENIEKITLPGKKKIYRYMNQDGSFHGDAIIMAEEENPERMHHPTFPAKKTELRERPHEELMAQVVKDGKVITNLPSVQEIVAYKKDRFEKLDPEYKRFDNPHIYKVGISTKLMETRDDLLNLK